MMPMTRASGLEVEKPGETVALLPYSLLNLPDAGLCFYNVNRVMSRMLPFQFSASVLS